MRGCAELQTTTWHAHWIAPESRAETPEPDEFLSGQGEPAEFSRSLFRTTFLLDELPNSAPSRLTADSRYVLWVNGQEVGRGPARSQPYRQRYDDYDIASHLTVGTNVIAVLVTFYGKATSFWQPAPAGASPDAALAFEAAIGEQSIVSDDRWRVHRSPAWSVLRGANGGEGVPVELLDARLLPRNWLTADFDDSSWSRAALIRALHPGSLGRTRPPTYPFGRLLPRGISPLHEERRSPQRVLDSSLRRLPAWSDDHPVTRVTQVLLAETIKMTAPGLGQPVPLSADAAYHLALDFGRIVAGYVEFDLDAPRDTVVELHYREKPFHPERAWSGEDPVTGARYIAAGGENTFSALEFNGFRYAHVVVHAPETATITISRFEVRERLYPRTGGTYFRSDDSGLNALYSAGIRTVQLNSSDAYTDCPTREQRSWVGDGVVHQMVDLVSNEDWGLARNFLELGDSPRPDGILPMVVVGDVEAGGGLTIPDWSLNWTHGVHVQYWHDGDLDRLRRHLPTFERVLRWYAAHVDDRGTIADVPEWNLVDWASLLLSGRSSILTALWARSLREFANLSDAVGNAGSAGWARQLYAAAAQGYQDFWDAGRGLYVDHILDGQPQAAASQVAQACAIVSGLAPRDRWPGLVDRMTDPDRLVVRSWIGSQTGGYDMERFREQMRGVQRIDWDPEEQMVLAEPFFSYAVHDAVAQAGRAELLIDLVRRWDEFLVNGYDTFGECWGWGTPVHGWSSTPTRDLVVYVLGVTPAEPGYRKVRVAPRPGRLAELAGAVPTPHGRVEVRIRGSEAEIDSPVPVVVEPAGQAPVEVSAGSHRVSIR